MPTRSRQGEQIGVRVTVFNYMLNAIEALVLLEGSDSYKFVHVEEEGIVRLILFDLLIKIRKFESDNKAMFCIRLIRTIRKLRLENISFSCTLKHKMRSSCTYPSFLSNLVT